MQHLTLSPADAAAGLALSMPAWRPPLPPVFRADLGRQRAFLSRGDALAYDRGYRAFPVLCHAIAGTPFSMGWHDAEEAATGGTAGRVQLWHHAYHISSQTYIPGPLQSD